MWVRSARWDCVWLLSGIPLGAGLTGAMLLGAKPQLLVLWIILLLQTGHLLSPMAAAWSHDNFRTVMWRQPARYVITPLAILIGATLIAYVSSFFLHEVRFNPASFSLSVGPTTLEEFQNPFMLMVAIYTFWNAYHFAMQAFGVMSIYRHKAGSYHPGQRLVDMIYCCLVIWATMLMPFIPRMAKWTHDLAGWPEHARPFLDYVQQGYALTAVVVIVLMLWREWRVGPGPPRILFIVTDGFGMIMTFWFGLWGFAIIAINHWLVAIGLASHIHANHRGGSTRVFSVGLIAAGMVIFCLLFVNIGMLTVTGFSTDTLYFTVTAVGCRLGLGFVHFLYDRWIYKLSDPQVRATIGRDVFCPASMSCTSSKPSKLRELANHDA
jgi:hypothetical protein